jgi:tetraspanin-11
MMLTYFITLFLMFVVLVIGGVLGYVFRDQVEDNIRPEMRHTLEVYDPATPEEAVTAAWDDTQQHVRKEVARTRVKNLRRVPT